MRDWQPECSSETVLATSSLVNNGVSHTLTNLYGNDSPTLTATHCVVQILQYLFTKIGDDSGLWSNSHCKNILFV